MERDPNISRIIRESGLQSAPDHFTGKVMTSIGVETAKTTYRPLIGKAGRIMILLFIMGIVGFTLFYAEPGDPLLEFGERLSNILRELSGKGLNFEFITNINVSAWLASTVVALFLLVLSDFLLRRRRRTV